MLTIKPRKHFHKKELIVRQANNGLCLSVVYDVIRGLGLLLSLYLERFHVFSLYLACFWI